MKKILGILVCMLMVIPVLATTVTAYDEPPLEFPLIRGGFGATIWIKNVVDEEVTDIYWEMEFQDSPMFTEKYFSGTIDSLAPGEIVKIRTGPVFGLPSRVSVLWIYLDFPGNNWGYGVWITAYIFGPCVFIFLNSLP